VVTRYRIRRRAVVRLVPDQPMIRCCSGMMG